jgi:hypothetical protein
MVSEGIGDLDGAGFIALAVSDKDCGFSVASTDITAPKIRSFRLAETRACE